MCQIQDFKGESMRRSIVVAVVSTVTLLVGSAVAQETAGQARATPYPNMFPADSYLMADRSAEIALARSAAPASISNDAEVLVLGSHGFDVAIKGRNGFTCFVGRGWTSAADPDYWNPKVRVPMCANAAAARTYLPRIRRISALALALAGHTLLEVNAKSADAVTRKELSPMEPGAMCYMMSKQGYGGEVLPHWPSHLMFFYSDLDPATWGANLLDSPVLAAVDPSEHLTQFVIPVGKWSDGTDDMPPAPHIHP